MDTGQNPTEQPMLDGASANQYQYNQGAPQAIPIPTPVPDPAVLQHALVSADTAPKCNPQMFLGVTVSVYCECPS